MAQVARHLKLAQKAEAALIAAIEVYNKPDFRYREETFAILATNAWELLLKARVLQKNGNDPKSIWLYERRRDKKGNLTKKLYKKRNRSGNPQTVGPFQAVSKIEAKGEKIPEAVKLNLTSLVEIRDNAVHFMNAGPLLSKQVLELGTAAIRNFVNLSKTWFGRDLSRVNLYLMPLGFLRPPKESELIVASVDEKRVVKFLADLMKSVPSDASEDFQVALSLDLRFKKVATANAASVVVSQDPSALKVTLAEEDIRKTFPWDYQELTTRCKARYLGFKVNGKYHGARRKLATDPKLCQVRFLDPGNPKSARKEFFSPNILQEFDAQFPRIKGS